MKAKSTRKSRLTRELLETAKGMRTSGVMDSATYDKITMRHWNGEARALPMSGEEIRELRVRSRLSQAVFARVLNLSTGYVSQLERGVKHPTGPALALLNVIRRKGFEAIR